MTQLSWKEKLQDAMPKAWADEVDAFEAQMELMKKGELDEKLFMEARLRRGAYGQRYDNGLRHDGVEQQTLTFPQDGIIKGPGTHWDAPGMHRIKIPFGKLSADQLEVLAECAEEYSDAILHITTRQDIQLHFIHIEDTPDLMRRLAAVGITTREACGNSVRNVTACPFSGVCHDESFDVTPYANAMAFYFLGHPDVQDFGRKFKVALSGCKENPCGLVNFHDLGAIAVMRTIDGKPQRAFELYVGGGLGSVPHEAKLLDTVSEEELLPMSQAVCRVFARLGEKKNRSRARVKFLVKSLGIEEFRRLVFEERKTLRADEEWTAFLEDLHNLDETPLKQAGTLPQVDDAEFKRWYASNVFKQKQAGYAVVTLTLPLGDITSQQARVLANMARRYTGDTMRTTVEQNLAFRWISEADIPAFYNELKAIGLAEPGASTITDITSCPGTDTCKLGISASRGLAGELRNRLNVIHDDLAEPVQKLRIKASGCFNACGQHHVADLGFLGVSRNVGGRRVPHFQVVLGGEWNNNGGSYGLAIGAVPSKKIPEATQLITEHYTKHCEEGESFQDFIKRIGKAQIRSLLSDIMKVPAYADDPSYYSDWGDAREYTIGDMGVGECAGEVVPFIEFGLQASERESFDAQVALDNGDAAKGLALAYGSMVTAAKALLRHREHQVSDEADDVVAQFRTHFHDTQLFHDPFAGGKFAQYFFKLHERIKSSDDKDQQETVHQAIEEAQLFIEAAHGCYARMSQTASQG